MILVWGKISKQYFSGSGVCLEMIIKLIIRKIDKIGYWKDVIFSKYRLKHLK